MSGISPLDRTRKTGYSLTATRRAHSVGFLFNVVMLEPGCYLFAELMACQVHHEIRITFSMARLRLALSASRTC